MPDKETIQAAYEEFRAILAGGQNNREFYRSAQVVCKLFDQLLPSGTHTSMPELSPAAQAIINAAVEAGGGYGRATPMLHARLAAVLRAAANQVAPVSTNRKQLEIRFDLLRIADELEAQ